MIWYTLLKDWIFIVSINDNITSIGRCTWIQVCIFKKSVLLYYRKLFTKWQYYNILKSQMCEDYPNGSWQMTNTTIMLNIIRYDSSSNLAENGNHRVDMGSSLGFNACHPDMISWLIQRVRNLDSLYRDASSSHWIVWDVARPDMRISPQMGHDRITCLPLRWEPPDHKAHCWRVPTHCIPWRPATFWCSGMVVKTVNETVRVFQRNNNNREDRHSCSGKHNAGHLPSAGM